MLSAALLLLLSASEDPWRALEANLRGHFGHCAGFSVKAGSTLEVTLPTRCTFSDGHTAAGTLRFERTPVSAPDAPTRDSAQRLKVVAAPFTLDALQFDGVLLEGTLAGDDLKLLPRSTPLKTRRAAPTPDKQWVESRPPKDHRLDPIGDAARDTVQFLAAAPAIASALGQELTRVISEGTLQSAPELVAFWALSGAPPPDAGAPPPH